MIDDTSGRVASGGASGGAASVGGAGRVALLVLGMHRSGTSGLAGTLAHLGCSAPLTPIEAGRQNPHGFFESWRVARLDDRILEAAGSTWHDWRPLDPPERPDSRGPGAWTTAELGQAAASLIAEEFDGADLIVLKDPRICRLAPVWLEALAAASYRPLPVLIHRHPLEVAQSLRARNGFPLAFGVLLWLRHALDAERLTRGHRRAFTSYDGLLSDWRSVAGAIEDRLGLRFPLSLEEAGSRVDAFLSAGLRHFAAPPDDELPDPSLLAQAEEAFEVLRRWASDGEDDADHPALDRMHAVLTAAGWAYAPPKAARVESLESRLDAARANAAALEGQIARLKGQVAQEAEGRSVLARSLESVHGAFLEMVGRTQELDRERVRQTRELGALARLVGEAEERQSKGQEEIRRLTDRVSDLKGQLKAAEKAHGEAEKRRSKGEEEVRKLTGRVSDLKGQLKAAETAHGEAEERYQEILRSSSWRVTAPLRRVMHRGQRLLRPPGSTS